MDINKKNKTKLSLVLSFKEFFLVSLLSVSFIRKKKHTNIYIYIYIENENTPNLNYIILERI